MLKGILLIIIIYLFYAVIPTFYYKIKTIIKRKEKGNTIYLTFDDGPNCKYTPLLLDILKKYNIKASFFCVTSFALNNEKIVSRMEKENHLIAIHSEYHNSAYLMGSLKTNKDFKNSIENMEKLNKKIEYYRPPWGAINLSTIFNIKKYNLKLILWNVMVGDWKKNISSDKIGNKLLKRIKASDIICLHDGRGKNEAPLRTINALDKVIPVLLEKGYKFETVDNYEK